VYIYIYIYTHVRGCDKGSGTIRNIYHEDLSVCFQQELGVKIFNFSISFRPALGSTQPPTQCEPWALSPEVKRQGCEADHSSTTSAEVKKT
jgi:hypothetical protein